MRPVPRQVGETLGVLQARFAALGLEDGQLVLSRLALPHRRPLAIKKVPPLPQPHSFVVHAARILNTAAQTAPLLGASGLVRLLCNMTPLTPPVPAPTTRLILPPLVTAPPSLAGHHVLCRLGALPESYELHL
jgi:hypothetical protein